MATRPLLIIVTGLPAAGKTHLSKIIANELLLPRFARDDISETLFDGLELEPSDWAGIHRRSSYALIFWTMEQVMRAGQSFIVECSFGGEQSTRHLAKLINQYDYEPLQIVLTAETDTLLERYRGRIEAPTKNDKTHPVHFAYLTYDKYKEKLEAGRWTTDPLEIGGDSWKFDTTDVDRVDYSELLDQLKTKLKD